MPPLAPPKGMLTTAHFHVISAARPRISSRLTFGPYRTPPLQGPRAMLCWTLKPSNTSSLPSSMVTGIWTMISRLGVRRYFKIPSSRASLWAATSNRAAIESKTLNSLSVSTVDMGALASGRFTSKASISEGQGSDHRTTCVHKRPSGRRAGGDGGGFRAGFCRHGMRRGEQFPGALFAEKAADQGDVHGVPGTVGNDVPDQRTAEHDQVANQVQNLVPAELVWKAQPFRIHHAGFGENNSIIERAPADETTLPKHFDFVDESERSGWGNAAFVAGLVHCESTFLFSDQRMIEGNSVSDFEFFGRINCNPLLAVHDLDWLHDFCPGFRRTLLSGARLPDELEEGQGAAVHNRNFKVVNFDDRIIN